MPYPFPVDFGQPRTDPTKGRLNLAGSAVLRQNFENMLQRIFPGNRGLERAHQELTVDQLRNEFRSFRFEDLGIFVQNRAYQVGKGRPLPGPLQSHVDHSGFRHPDLMIGPHLVDSPGLEKAILTATNMASVVGPKHQSGVKGGLGPEALAKHVEIVVIDTRPTL